MKFALTKKCCLNIHTYIYINIQNKFASEFGILDFYFS